MIALVPCLLSGVKIFALPELQNLDSSPNGRGTDLDELSNLFSIAASRNRDLVDVTTFGRKGWEYKDEGSVWHADEIQWRVDHMKGFLKGILLGGGMKRVEVAVVSHGSFLRKLVKEGELSFNPMLSSSANVRYLEQSLLKMWHSLPASLMSKVGLERLARRS
jgi:hypothetical protein